MGALAGRGRAPKCSSRSAQSPLAPPRAHHTVGVAQRPLVLLPRPLRCWLANFAPVAMSVTSHSVQMDTLNAVELQRMVANLEARLERAKNALSVKEGNTTAAVSELSAARGRGRSTARGAHHHRGASRGGRGKTPLAAAPARSLRLIGQPLRLTSPIQT